VSKGKFK